MHGTLLVTGGAAGASVEVEPVALTDPELDHGVLGAGPETPVAFEAVAAGKAAGGLVNCTLGRQTADHLGESRHPLGRLQFRLPLANGVAEVPQVQLVEGCRGMLRLRPSAGCAAE